MAAKEGQKVNGDKRQIRKARWRVDGGRDQVKGVD